MYEKLCSIALNEDCLIRIHVAGAGKPLVVRRILALTENAVVVRYAVARGLNNDMEIDMRSIVRVDLTREEMARPAD